MITLEQVRRLEKGVHNAVAAISAVRGENALLKQKLAGYENRIAELEAGLAEFKDDQSEIERGLLAALDQLDTLEDEIFEEPAPQPDEDHGEFVAPAPAAAEAPAAEAAGRRTEAPESSGSDDDPTNDKIADEQQSADELDIF